MSLKCQKCRGDLPGWRQNDVLMADMHIEKKGTSFHESWTSGWSLFCHLWSNGGTSSALSLYSLTFLIWYISYDSPLKGYLKDMFLLPLITCIFPSLTIPFFFPFGLGRFGFAALLLWFKTTSTTSEAPCLILIPNTFIDLWTGFKFLQSCRNKLIVVLHVSIFHATMSRWKSPRVTSP